MKFIEIHYKLLEYYMKTDISKIEKLQQDRNEAVGLDVLTNMQ